ncbi:MAG: bifunctional metallophosphatase/5'-nucleotidase [Acidobacteria bacterium]|nr:bifunctional metallophosphatase/5'-nucleotidase [Acidobacteriota bacterium]
MTRISWIAVVSVAATVTVTAVVQLAQVGEPAVDVQLLAINDFHGALEPASGGNGRIGSADAGGIEYLATHLARLKATNPNTFIVSAGDNIGGTPLLSSLFHDEPSIEALNVAGLQLSALGNHDLDEGWWELLRVQRGGCHPVDGCQDGTPFSGASFAHLAANVTLDPRKADPLMLALAGVRGAEPRPLLPPYAIREIDGVRVGFIGVVTQDTPRVILPTSVRGLAFGPEPDAANTAARTLREQGVRAIVVLMHAGAERTGADINGCGGVSRPFIDLVSRLSDDIDVVVSGHTHHGYNCTIDGKLVTSAASAGRLVTDIDLRVRRSDGEIVAKAARNVIVTRDVAKDAAQTALLEHYRSLGNKGGSRVVGSITGSLTRDFNDAAEFSLGDLVADALLEAARRTPGANAEIAIWNPGGIRADLVAAPGSGPTPVTYAQVFAVLPFGNELIVKTVTGDTLLQMLEQQFGAERVRIMQVSSGFSYAYAPSRPRGQRIIRESVRINGAPLELTRQYRLATSDFLWETGDGLTALGSSTDPVLIGVDYEILADYFSRHSPIRPGSLNRIRKIR